MTSAATLTRAYVNDGGDIALHLTPGESFRVGLVERPSSLPVGYGDHSGIVAGAWYCHQRMARAQLFFGNCRRGYNSSGSRGGGGRRRDDRSQRRGSAGASGIVRVPAREIAPDSDLGDRLVTRGVGRLTPAEIDGRAGAGAAVAEVSSTTA